MAEIIYFSDPMCSWCWGFSPVIARLRQNLSESYDFTLIMGGLRPGETRPMDKSTSEMVAHHWEEVNRRTGQPFDHSFFDRKDFIYDTEPAARAVVTARELHEGMEFEFLHRVQEAFYARNQDPKTASFYREIAQSFAWDADQFIQTWESEAARKATAGDFELTQRIGIRGFPATVVRNGESLKLLSHGWRPVEGIMERLRGIEALENQEG